MAINKPGEAGKFTGKIGQTVLSAWRKLHIARSAPAKSRKKPSIAQLEQRLRLKIASGFLQRLTEFINIGFPSNKKNMTNMNVAQQHFLKNAITGTYPNLIIDHTQIQMSSGDLAQVYNLRMSLTSGIQEVMLTWQNPVNLKLGIEEHDQVQLCLYAENAHDRSTWIFRDVAFRSDLKVTLPFSGNWSIIHIWMFLISADKKRASITKYLGMQAL